MFRVTYSTGVVTGGAKRTTPLKINNTLLLLCLHSLQFNLQGVSRKQLTSLGYGKCIFIHVKRDRGDSLFYSGLCVVLRLQCSWSCSIWIRICVQYCYMPNAFNVRETWSDGWFLGYLTTLFQQKRICTVKWNGKLNWNDAYVRIWREAVVACYKILSRNSPEKT